MAIAIFPLLTSCEEEEEIKLPPAYNTTWADSATLKFNPADGKTNGFEYNVVLGAGGTEYWNVTTVDFDVNVDIESGDVSEISKIDIYVFAEEKNGDEYNYLGGDNGKLLKTISSPAESFIVSITKDELGSLFKDDFSTSRNGDILVEDFFELKWVITGKNGKTIDTRTECAGFDCSFGFGAKIVEVAPPIWEGTFNYEWITLTDNAKRYGRVDVGQTGTMTFTLQPGSFTEYDVSHLAADYYYSSAGSLKYGYVDGTVELSGGNRTAWNIVDVNGATLTIEFSYRYSVGYDEYGTFTLTRTDGQDWPSNLKN